jgi:hypothetical protein
MTGSWLVTLPALIVLPHEAQMVLPPSLFWPPSFDGLSPLFLSLGIENEIASESPPGLADFFGRQMRCR